MTEQDVIQIFGKSIWKMTVAELVENELVEVWARLVNENAKED